MARIFQNRDAELSMLQSAIDEVAIAHKAGGGAQSVGEALASNTTRPGIEDPMVFQAASLATDVAHMNATAQTSLQPGPAPGAVAVEGIGEGAKYCASLAFNYAKAKAAGDAAGAAQAWADLNAPTGSCDLRYAEAALKAAEYFTLGQGQIPYVPWKALSDFVIDDGAQTLPANATIAVIGDWGTGQPEALAVLEAIADKHPDVVIHLGDVYYSGTDPEQQHYFFDNWCRILGLTIDANRNVTSKKPRTFSLPGNHDMYSGGGPYYAVIKQLGQQASFFCLRNHDWQFIGLDTGYYDHTVGGACTHLSPNLPTWLADKVNNGGGRKTVLLSHHQLFSNNETFDAKDGTPAGYTNPTLMKEVEGILPKVTLWLWGHQHEFVAYADPRVRARCIGHGAYPVGISELGKNSNTFPLDPAITPAQHGIDFWDNGYTLIKLNGKQANVTYYAVDDQGNERGSPATETI